MSKLQSSSKRCLVNRSREYYGRRIFNNVAVICARAFVFGIVESRCRNSDLLSMNFPSVIQETRDLRLQPENDRTSE